MYHSFASTPDTKRKNKKIRSQKIGEQRKKMLHLILYAKREIEQIIKRERKKIQIETPRTCTLVSFVFFVVESQRFVRVVCLQQ